MKWKKFGCLQPLEKMLKLHIEDFPLPDALARPEVQAEHLEVGAVSNPEALFYASPNIEIINMLWPLCGTSIETK